MADLVEGNASLSVKQIGASATGIETSYANVSTTGEAYSRDILDGGGIQAALTVGLTAVELKVGASRKALRKLVTVYHLTGVGKVYYGHTSAVTTATGTPIAKTAYFPMALGENTELWLVSDTAAQVVRITEVS